MRIFKILIGIAFWLWSGACIVNACGHWNALRAVHDATGEIDPNTNSVKLLAWAISLFVAFVTFAVGGYLATKR